MEIAETREGWFEPLFTVNDICGFLNISPSSIRTWIRRGWLEFHSYEHEHGYKISWAQLQAFLDKYSEKLKKVKQAKLEDIVPKEYHPEQITKNILFKRLTEKVSKDYKLWVFEVCFKQSKTGLPVMKLLEMDDEEIAENFNLPLPDGYHEVKQESKEELESIKTEEVERFMRITTRNVAYIKA